MKIFKVGDTLTAPCNTCRSLEAVTFQLRDVPFTDNSAIVKGVLVGVCDRCNSVAVLPHQSTPAVRKSIEVQRKSLESRVPAHLIDILNLVSYQFGGGTDFTQPLIKFYIHELSKSKSTLTSLVKFLQTDLAQGKAEKRISLKGRLVAQEMEQIKKITNIQSTSDIIKSIVLQINDDILVKKKPKRIQKVKDIIAATA